MRKRVRFLSIKGGVGKSIFTLLLANYLSYYGIPFIVEELDPLQTVCILSPCNFPVIKYFTMNDILYNRLNIDLKKIKKEYDKIDWKISIADMLTGISPENPIISFQDSLTELSLNVFLTDKHTINRTVEYAREWFGPRILIINMVPDEEIHHYEEEGLEYVYGEGLFQKVFVLPYLSSLDIENDKIKSLIRELLSFINIS